MARSSRAVSQVSGETTDAAMAIDFLAAVRPPLQPSTMEALRTILPAHPGISISTLSAMGGPWVKDLLKLDSTVEVSRIMSAIGDPTTAFAPPPLGPNGEPVIVRPKVGFTELSQVDTVNQTLNVRFYLDLYWNDPRVVGMDHVPDGIWRPANCYIINGHGDFQRILHNDRPVLIDAKTGLLLWPVEMSGSLQNPMDLHSFPFDEDGIELHIHQNEQSSRDEYLLRPFTDPEEEATSVRFFFGVFDDLTEFEMRGFSKEAYEGTGGNLIEYSQIKVTLHIARRFHYYMYKVVVPQFIATIFCFSALVYPIDTEGDNAVNEGIFRSPMDFEALTERNNVSATILLASFALLYTVSTMVPKTSYQTLLDKFMTMSLLIQFGVAVTSWLSVGAFFSISNEAARILNYTSLGFHMLLLLVSTVLIFGKPLYRGLKNERTAWPSTLDRDEPSVVFHPFDEFKNVFPPWNPGSKNPIKLAEKHYGAAAQPMGKKPDLVATQL